VSTEHRRGGEAGLSKVWCGGRRGGRPAFVVSLLFFLLKKKKKIKLKFPPVFTSPSDWAGFQLWCSRNLFLRIFFKN
jgi:hypothetical protein